MNILITPDIPEWALGRLTRSIVKHNPRFNFYNIPVHPRGILQGLTEIKKLLKGGIKFDLWHAQYWNSAYQLLEMIPELHDIPKILTHHNHYALEEREWNEFDKIVIPTKFGQDVLEKKYSNIVKIPYGIDLDTYSFVEEYPPAEPAVGYIGRVVPHKNLDEICRVSLDLGYRVVGCGYIDKPDYWTKCEPYLRENLKFSGGMGRGGMMSENFEAEIYRKMTCFVMYSTDEKETGTLPLLEAMARGVPVLATEQGMARDIIQNGENGILFNRDNFASNLKLVMEDEKLRIKLRNNAWKTIRTHSEQKMARDYAQTYYQTIYGGKKIISVIVPTFNRADTLIEVLTSIEMQKYPAKEIIVCDDGSDDTTKEVVSRLKKEFSTPILYLLTGDKLEYGLAKARNCGAIEALGDILLFLDDRLALEDGALETISANCDNKNWFFGSKMVKEKPSTKTNFVENFAWINKKDFIAAGMFCERINLYGGLSQETRQRFGAQGFSFKYIPEARAKEIRSASMSKKRGDIWKAKLMLQKMYD